MKNNTKFQGIFAMIFTVISVVLTIIFFVLCLKDGESFLGTLVAAPMLGFTFGGMIPGFCHASVIDYCNKYIEKEIKESMCCCQDWGGKFHGLILRIACILHCADCCSRGVEPSEENVNHDTLVRSFSIAHYYRYQAIYGFSVNAPDGNIVKAEKIIQIIKTKNIKQVLKSDLYHACRCNLFPSAKDFYSALDTLAEYGYIAYEDVTAANNKKAQMVHVNPHI